MLHTVCSITCVTASLQARKLSPKTHARLASDRLHNGVRTQTVMAKEYEHRNASTMLVWRVGRRAIEGYLDWANGQAATAHRLVSVNLKVRDGGEGCWC